VLDMILDGIILKYQQLKKESNYQKRYRNKINYLPVLRGQKFSFI
jgi:hypothetical protein